MNELTLKNINKHYGKKHALKDFSFTFTDGVYGLLGPNGAGKSTLMHLITDNLLPDKKSCSEILWNGTSIFELKEKYREILGFMPQQQALYPNMTARYFLGYMSALKGLSKQESQKQIDEVLADLELFDDADKLIGGFSGGMKQRVLIAAAILGNPKLIIMDEPTAGLDPKQRVIIRRLTEKLGCNRIIIVSTHIVSDIESIEKEILLIRSGKLIANGTVEELTAQVHSGEHTLEKLYLQYYGGDAT
jgi:ABC-type multidrug transport system ATPase subunit